MSTKSYKFRIYPKKKVIFKLKETLENCRLLYNNLLEFEQHHYESGGKFSKFLLISSIPNFEVSKRLHSQVAQNIGDRLTKAFQNFFRRVKHGETPGYPRFKSYGRYDSFTYPQSGFKFKGNEIFLSKIGSIKINLHRELKGKIKTCIIKCEGIEWYAIFSTQEDRVVPEVKLRKYVGIDLGCIDYITTNKNKKIVKPKYYKESEKQYTKIDKKISEELNLDKKKKLYNKRRKVYQKLRNRRSDFLHKTSRKIVDKFDLICMEDLDVKNMVKKSKGRGLTKSILDNNFRELTSMIVYKAEEAGKKVVLVNPKFTSQMCSGCGELVPKKLSIRTHNCPHCNLKISRDQNAAINILRLGLDSLGLTLDAPAIAFKA
jgi:putative transposase